MALLTGWPPSVIEAQDYSMMLAVKAAMRQRAAAQTEAIETAKQKAEFERELRAERRSRGM